MLGRRLVVVVALGISALAGCGYGMSESPSSTVMDHTSTVIVRLPLAPYGGCGDAVFHAIGEGATSALIVAVDAAQRSTDESTVLDITLPDPAVTVTLQRGEALDQPMCNDVLGPEYRVDSEVQAVAGSVHIELGPRSDGLVGSGSGVHGLATTHDIVMQDGTYLVDLYISTDQIGTYAG